MDAYVLDLKAIYLNHADPEWYQYLTGMMCHADFKHLTGNMFFIFFFGRFIEEELKAPMFVSLYLVSGILVNILNVIFMQHNGYSVGASGVVFAFFTISLLLKPRSDWRSWVEIIVLGPFVISHILNELNSLGMPTGDIGHGAHIIGAVLGIALFYGSREWARWRQSLKT